MTHRRKFKNKKKSKKGKKGNSSESSTPQSSTPSVEDEKQQLIKGGACGSSGSRESRSAEKTKRGSERTSPGKRSPYQSPGATSSRYVQFGHSSETDLLTVPDQERGACGQSSPSKRSTLDLLKNVFATKKKSPNRSSDPECSCKDKGRHQPECPKRKNFAAYAKDKSSERKSTEISSNESKPPSSNASPIISKKNEDGTQSSSSSDPTVVECFRNASESEQPPEKSLLTVPDQESAGIEQSSPSKKSPLMRLKNVFKSKRKSPNRSSDTECICKDKADHKLECQERRKHKTDAKDESRNLWQTKSEASSSSGSPISKKNKRRGASNVSSESSRRSNSKSSSNSDPNVVEYSCPGKGDRALECSSDNKSLNKSKSNTESSRNPTDYDPQEGTSSGPARYERNQEHPSGRDDTEIGGDAGEDANPLIEQQGPRRRSRSFASYLWSVTPRRLSPRRCNWRKFKIQLGKFEWHWFEEIRRPRKANTERDPAEDERDPSKDVPDNTERELLMQLEAVRLVPSVGRHETLSPSPLRKCNCKEGKKTITHDLGCPLFNDLRRRRKLKKCRQDVRLTGF